MYLTLISTSGRENGWADLFIRPLEMFFSKYEFDDSAGRSSKIESGPYLIMLSFISILITSFGPEPFILHCFVS